MLPSNRDLAAAIILLAIVAAFLASSHGRKAAGSIFRIFWGKLLVILLAYCAYVFGVVALANWLGLWRWAMLSETVTWFFLSGLVMFGRFNTVSKDRWFVRNSLLALVETGALIGLLATVVSFHLLVELVLAITLSFLVLLQTVADMDDKFRPARPVLSWGVVLFVAGIAVATVWSVATNWTALDKGAILLSFGMAFWLPAAVLPAVLVIGAFAEYELAFIRMDFMAGTPNRWMARIVLFLGLLVRPNLVAGFSHAWRWELRQAPTWRSAYAVIRRYRRAQTRSLERLLRGETESLVRLARGRNSTNRSPHAIHDEAAFLELVRDRPPVWEYVLFGETLAHLLADVQAWSALRERSADATSGVARSRAAAIARLIAYPTESRQVVSDVVLIFNSTRRDEAFGRPGEPGDAVRIIRLAGDVIHLYARLLDLGFGLRSIAMDGELLTARDALRAMTAEPAQQIAGFVEDLRSRTAALPDQLKSGEPIELIMRLELSISDETVGKVEQAFANLGASEN